MFRCCAWVVMRFHTTSTQRATSSQSTAKSTVEAHRSNFGPYPVTGLRRRSPTTADTWYWPSLTTLPFTHWISAHSWHHPEVFAPREHSQAVSSFDHIIGAAKQLR